LLDLDNSAVEQLTHNVQSSNVYLNGLSWSPDGKWLAFSTNQNGNFNIVMISADGSEIKQVTTDPDDEQLPVFGTHNELLFVRTHYSDTTPPELTIIKLDLSSGFEDSITKTGDMCWYGSISINIYSEIAISGWCGTGAGNSYWSQLMTSSGTTDIGSYYPGVFTEGPCKDQSHGIGGVAWAHGSPYLAFTDSQDCFDPMSGSITGPGSIYILDISKQIPEANKIYTEDGTYSPVSVDWSPDDQYIIFSEYDRGLWLIDIHTGEVKQISQIGSNPVWRP
jgi:Tol biopolymer transport system component